MILIYHSKQRHRIKTNIPEAQKKIITNQSIIRLAKTATIEGLHQTDQPIFIQIIPRTKYLAKFLNNAQPRHVRAQKKEFTYVETDEPPLYGPRNWGEINRTCDGQFQSPVNLLNNDFSGTIAPRLEFKGFTTTPAGATLTNNGHSVVIKWLPSTGLPAAISGGVLKSTFIVDNAHFHWGRTDSTGSEHFIASRQFSLELHIVCFNSQYGKLLNHHIRVHLSTNLN